MWELRCKAGKQGEIGLQLKEIGRQRHLRNSDMSIGLLLVKIDSFVSEPAKTLEKEVKEASR